MSHDEEEEESEDGFKIGGADGDEALDMPEFEMDDDGESDPDKDR